MVEAKLQEVFRVGANERPAAIAALVTEASAADLISIIGVVASEQASIQDAKPVLEAIAKTKVPKLKNDDCIAVCEAAMSKLEPRKQFFAKEDALFRRGMVDVYDARDDFYEAVQMLKGITYDGDCYEEKIEDWLNLATYQFEMKDSTAAETFVNKVMHILHHTEDNDKILRYRMAYAKVQDSNRDFLNAAQGYYNASNLTGVDGEQVTELLDCALTCTILAPAGPRKARLLAILYSDERIKSNQFYDLLAKIFNGEVIRKEHVAEFKQKLEDFQNITMTDGYSVLERALIEHNIVVISKIYMNIRFSELGNFLGIQPEQAEDFIANMVEQGRIQAVLDQENELVEFEEEGRQQQTFND